MEILILPSTEQNENVSIDGTEYKEEEDFTVYIIERTCYKLVEK